MVLQRKSSYSLREFEFTHLKAQILRNSLPLRLSFFSQSVLRSDCRADCLNEWHSRFSIPPRCWLYLLCFRISHFNLISAPPSRLDTEQLCVFESAGRKRDSRQRAGSINVKSTNQSRQTLDGTVVSVSRLSGTQRLVLQCAVVLSLYTWIHGWKINTVI